MRFFLVAAIMALGIASGVSAHGYMSYPVPRGAEKITTQFSSLKNPTTDKSLCRNEPVGKITKVSGNTINMKFEIAEKAIHKGPCTIRLYDKNLGNPIVIDKDGDCFPDKPYKTSKVTPSEFVEFSRSVKLPSGLKGRYVLQFDWTATHLVTEVEEYRNCADIEIGGSGDDSSDSSSSDADAQDADSTPKGGKPKTPSTNTPKNAPKNVPKNAPKNAPKNDDSSESAAENNASEDEPEDGSMGTGSQDDGSESAAEDDAPEDKLETTSSESSSQDDTSIGNDGCEHGKFECDGDNISQCNAGKWVRTKCPPTTTCISENIHCG
ncbi:hypothetical protein THASP1DRAFT_21537 [Thamnocephalis sphaerospora]|uniref:Chitin-binding type-4 domain-containing protein n=1 Tax=Thamnocephalis sphaerospora TaxID=78915 RepID=A0A4P9XWU4_9FUNG|nr:hypothetical protein THASP1DRAFT_21537 [Thamnocephalis sphaerospora]|eukprot:RKP10825.1 hypothetical protein THASP1DRAFT_21537 [Thamnocephalis sphaerospora]